MAAVQVVAALIVAHAFCIAITTYRVKFRYSRGLLWFDDAFAVLVTVGGLFIVGILISTIIHTPLPRPIEYNINLAVYFFVLWACRACLVMATGRLVYKTYWPRLTPLFWLLSFIFLCIGAAFTTVAVVFCRIDRSCSSVEPCFCNLEPRMILCAMIVDVFVDIAALSTNWYVFVQTQKKLKTLPGKKWLVYSGLSSNILTLIVNIAFWVSYLKSSSGNHVLFFSMTNAVVIISSITCHSSAIVTIIYALLAASKGASIPITGASVEPQVIALKHMSSVSDNKIEETESLDVVDNKIDETESWDAVDIQGHDCIKRDSTV